MAETWKSSSSWYRARKAMRFLPTWSRSREELILQTYGDGNKSLEVGDDGATHPVFNDGSGSVRRRSGFKSCFSGSGGGMAPTPKRWIGSRKSARVA
jgi:hypothetical protein